MHAYTWFLILTTYLTPYPTDLGRIQLLSMFADQTACEMEQQRMLSTAIMGNGQRIYSPGRPAVAACVVWGARLVPLPTGGETM
jgi:hypothetical protein